MPTSFGPHHVDAGREPEEQAEQHDQDEPLAAHRAARDHVLQPVLAAAQDLLEIGRSAADRRRRRPAARSPTGRRDPPRWPQGRRRRFDCSRASNSFRQDRSAQPRDWRATGVVGPARRVVGRRAPSCQGGKWGGSPSTHRDATCSPRSGAPARRPVRRSRSRKVNGCSSSGPAGWSSRVLDEGGPVEGGNTASPVRSGVHQGEMRRAACGKARARSLRRRRRRPRMRPSARPAPRPVRGLVPAVRDVSAVGSERRIAGKDDVSRPGSGAHDRCEGLAAHQHRLAQGERAEAPQVRPQAPDQLVVAPDDAVLGDRRDEGEGAGRPAFRPPPAP